MYFDSPGQLQDVCVDYICGNMEALCELPVALPSLLVTRPTADHDRFLGSDDIYVHSELAEQMLTTLCAKGKLNDKALAMFQAKFARLKRVRIFNSPDLTLTGLRTLKTHKLTDLEATGLQRVTVNELVGCLNEWTMQNLRTLNVASSKFAHGSNLPSVVVSLSKLRNLRVLNVSNMGGFNRSGLEIVTEDLTMLESLDISNTRVDDVTPLIKLKDRLKYLAMYNLKISNLDEMVKTICRLTQLEHLDISDDKLDDSYPFELHTPSRMYIGDFLGRTDALPNLRSLDLSGKDVIDLNLLRLFIDDHKELKFLGLSNTDVCHEDMFTNKSHQHYNPDLLVTGSGTEAQILEALARYVTRPLYIQKSLYHLFRITQNSQDQSSEMIKLILPGMRAHPYHIGIQMAATACLYNLTKGELGQKLHPKWLQRIIVLTLVAMEKFPKHLQLQKNVLLTLCSDRILQDITFDKYKCAQLVMDCLCQFEDPSVSRMCVAICSILAAKISTSETSLLGEKPIYMRKLLCIVQTKIDEGVVDITMKFTLSALWNLTDESPTTCRAFIDLDGLQMFLKALNSFPSESAVETKVLGLINNIAEVRTLRDDLLKIEFIEKFAELLGSIHIDVSYFAAGILAHLASDGRDAWENAGLPYSATLQQLADVVLKWETPEGEMVAYRSFAPFFSLLDCYDSSPVQLWAVWAIHHVCTKNPKRYCPMLITEGGLVRIQRMESNLVSNEEVKRISYSILEVVKMEVGSAVVSTHYPE